VRNYKDYLKKKKKEDCFFFKYQCRIGAELICLRVQLISDVVAASHQAARPVLSCAIHPCALLVEIPKLNLGVQIRLVLIRLHAFVAEASVGCGAEFSSLVSRSTYRTCSRF
jgi:hypothetical protein